MVALIGPNGAGKTTALSLLVGLRRPDPGRAELFGGDPRQVPRPGRDRRHAPGTGVSGTLRGARDRRARARTFPVRRPDGELLGRFGLADIAAGRRAVFRAASGAGSRLRSPSRATRRGLPRRADRRPRHRVPPPVWPEIEGYAAGGGTVLLTTHHLEEAERLAGRIVLLARGRVVAEGTPAARRPCPRRWSRGRVSGADRDVSVRLVLLHARASTLELLRYPTFSVPTLAFPALFFLLFVAPRSDPDVDPTLLLASFTGFAVLGVSFFQFGVGIAAERESPWEQFVRTLPIRVRVRFAARVLSAALFGVASAALVVAAALATTDARLTPPRWFALAAALVLGALPFALLGIALGYWASPQRRAPDRERPVSRARVPRRALDDAAPPSRLGRGNLPARSHSPVREPAVGCDERAPMAAARLDSALAWGVVFGGLGALGLPAGRGEEVPMT